jgi:hypothetical protein
MKILMNRKKGTCPIPPPPSTLEKDELEGRFPTDDDFPSEHDLPCIPASATILARSPKISDNFHDYLLSFLRRWGLRRFTFDWDGNFDDRYNQISLQLFLRTFKQALLAREYGVNKVKIPRDDLMLSAMVYRHFKTLLKDYKSITTNSSHLSDKLEGNTTRRAQQRVSEDKFTAIHILTNLRCRAVMSIATT